VLFYEEAAISVPVMCMQCEDPACAKVCPVGAISRDENGAVVPNPKKCIACKMCISACPMGNISFSTVEKKIVKCNLCGGDPNCAKICPSGAIKYEDATTTNINKKRIIADKFKELFSEVKK
jgi:Fe-S-cluster-containing hydrogenase component 2